MRRAFPEVTIRPGEEIRVRKHISFSDLVRWGGLVAVVAGALFIIADLVTLVLAFGQGLAEGLLFRAAISGSAGLLLALGLVALYAHQTETAGYLGLVGFLAAFIGLWLGEENIVWAALLTNVGWALLGAASLGTRAYPRVAVILLIVGTVLAAVVSILLAAIQAGGTTVAYVTVVGAFVDIIFYAAVSWMGLSLFTRRFEDARRPARAKLPRKRRQGARRVRSLPDPAS